MARRTLTAHTIEFRRKYSRNRETLAPSNLDGVDLIDAFQEWCTDLDPDSIKDNEHKVWTRVQAVERTSLRILLVTLDVGSWGESGEVIDARDGHKIIDLLEEQAPTGMTRAALLVPPRGETALYFAEYSARGSGGSRLLRAFAHFWSTYSDSITMMREPVLASETWLEGASLTEVEVRLRGLSPDIADPIREVVGIQTHTIRPKRSLRFPFGLLQRLQRNPMIAGGLVGLSGLPDESEIYVTAEGRDGRSKKFLLDAQAVSPWFREVLNESDEEPLGDAEFIDHCTRTASDLLTRIGQQWELGWSS
jgi:hypothetical protein